MGLKTQNTIMNNQNSWTERELGMQIGACLNKAVDIAIARLNVNNVEYDTLQRKKFIEEWVDILFDIGTQKKQAVLEAQLKSEEQDKLGTPYDENYPQVEVASNEVS